MRRLGFLGVVVVVLSWLPILILAALGAPEPRPVTLPEPPRFRFPPRRKRRSMIPKP